MARNLVGLFPDTTSAEHAIVDLKAAGFDPARMGIVMQDRRQAHDVAESQSVQSTTGAITGGVIGGTLGTILAATGTFVIPGIGPFISGGILATALAGGAAGLLVGGLVGLGIPREEAEYYQGRVEQGSTLLTLDAQGREAVAQDIMLRHGAEDLRAQGYGYTDQVTSAQRADVAPETQDTSARSGRPGYTTDEDILAGRSQPTTPERQVSQEQHQNLGDNSPQGLA
jgi:hypothetical protein